MANYVLRRVTAMVPTFFIVSLVVFSMVRLIPGDIVDIMVENYQYADDKAALREELGLNDPLPIQYGRWMGGILTGDFGESLWTGNSIVQELQHRLPVTIQLGLMSIGLTILFAIPVGIISAVKQDTLIDYAVRGFTVLNLSIPAFWLATMVIVFPSIWWGMTIVKRWTPITEDPLASVAATILPATLLGLSRAAAVMRMTRAMMLEVLRQDFIRTARSKGLSSYRVIQGHAVKNALIPVITVLGLQVPSVLGGSIIIESIFNLPGTGRFMLESIQQRDYPLLQATALVFTIFVMVTNLVVDIVYGYLDPRIRFS